MGDRGGVVLTFLFAALLIGGLALMALVAIRALIGGVERGAPPPRSLREPVPARSEARRLLDERYARGELTTEEYQEHVANLEEEA